MIFIRSQNENVLRCDCNQQHVQALENDVGSVAEPYVTAEGHEEKGSCSKPRESTQSQLPPRLPSDLSEADSIGCGCTCAVNVLGLSLKEVF